MESVDGKRIIDEVMPPKSGKAVELKKGQRIRITDLLGRSRLYNIATKDGTRTAWAMKPVCDGVPVASDFQLYVTGLSASTLASVEDASMAAMSFFSRASDEQDREVVVGLM